MKRYSWLLLLLLLVPSAPALAQTDENLVTFEGFDYEDPDNDPSVFGQAGDWYNVVAFIQSGHPSLALDFSNNENTLRFFDLWSTGFEDFGNFRFVSYSNGRVRLFEEAIAGGTHGDFNGSAHADGQCVTGDPPANDTSPSTFIDGTLILGGVVSGFVVTIDLLNNTGSFNGDVAFDEGTKLGDIPSDIGRAYTFAGLASGAGACVPPGYDHQLSGEIRIERETATQNTSWGRMKALYR